MAFKFPFTNYHELNLTWVLDQLKKLFEESAENVSVIENYDGRLTAVETELPTVSENAAEASRSASAAASLAQTAKATADTAQENAIQAQGLAGQARQEAQAAQTAADAATQAAQQAQAIAFNFDGRITQAENDASEALEASRSFENRVQAAITTANNAAQTATNAQGIATRADQNAALALDTLNSQRAELERIGAEQAALITQETESGKTEIENLAQSVLDSIPADYTELSNLVDKKAPVIINSASGSIASFDDGADNMKIQKLVVNIEPVQAGSGDPSPYNVRPISGWTGAEIEQTGKNLLIKAETAYISPTDDYAVYLTGSGTSLFFNCVKGQTYTVSGLSINRGNYAIFDHLPTASERTTAQGRPTAVNNVLTFTAQKSGVCVVYANNETVDTSGAQIELGSATSYEPYTGNQISVTFPSAAGTVYGGTLTLNPDRTGTLVVDRAFATYNGSEDWMQYSQSTSFYLDNAVSAAPHNQYDNSNNLSNIAYWPKTVFEAETPNCIRFQSFDGQRLYIINSTVFTDLNSLKSYLSRTPLQICYTLATPIHYQLTAEQVSGILTPLYGTNNVWADTGDVEVTYPADTKLYIDGKLAELQATILENI